MIRNTTASRWLDKNPDIATDPLMAALVDLAFTPPGDANYRSATGNVVYKQNTHRLKFIQRDIRMAWKSGVRGDALLSLAHRCRFRWDMDASMWRIVNHQGFEFTRDYRRLILDFLTEAMPKPTAEPAKHSHLIVS